MQGLPGRSSLQSAVQADNNAHSGLTLAKEEKWGGLNKLNSPKSNVHVILMTHKHEKSSSEYSRYNQNISGYTDVLLILPGLQEFLGFESTNRLHLKKLVMAPRRVKHEGQADGRGVANFMPR